MEHIKIVFEIAKAVNKMTTGSKIFLVVMMLAYRAPDLITAVQVVA